MSNRQEFIKIDFKTKSIGVGVKYLEFKDGEHIIRYAPSLNLSGYGSTSKEADEMMRAALVDFCEHLRNMPESDATKELTSLGWKRNKYFNKKFETGKSYIDKEGILKEFDLPQDTVVEESFIAA